MTAALIIQQQQLRRRRKALTPSQGGPWAWWDAETIADICAAPRANVEQHWPLIHAALVDQGIDDRATQIAVLATVAVETGNFRPIPEYGPDGPSWPD